METVFRILYSLLAATALAGLAAWRKALTRGGLLLAWVLAAVIGFCGGAGAFLALTATFVFTIAAGKLSQRVREPIEGRLHAKTGKRDAAQIFCNVFVGTLTLAVFRLTGAECFCWAYAGAMSASLADSMASELGVLSKRRPVDLCTLRPTEKGLSGGVTLLGLGTSLLGACVIAAICAAFWGWRLFPAAAIAGFLAALCDSALGSLCQAKYRCPACGALTEKPLHCGAVGGLEKGFRCVTNDAVNFCNNIVGALAALGLYFL